MLLLTARFDPTRPARRSRLARPVAGLGLGLVVAAGLGHWLVGRGGLAASVGWPLASASVHGGFLALGWILALEGRGWQRPALRTALAVLVAFAAARVSPWGVAGLALLPLWLVREGVREPRLRAIGFALPHPGEAAAVGLAIGALLGAHLLVAASLTFGYPVRASPLQRYASLLAYDIGANALGAEWLFRGALFSHWWRLGGFWPAASVATGLGLVRYLVDPALPLRLETTMGAVFYLALLGAACCGLRAWSGSLLPGYLASVAFFAAYRAVAVW